MVAGRSVVGLLSRSSRCYLVQELLERGHRVTVVDNFNQPESLLGVNVAGYFTSEKGLGEAGRASIRALEAAGIPFVLNNFADYSSANKEATDQGLSDTNPYGINLIHVNAEQVPEFVARKGDAYFHGRTNIGFWFWELAQFPNQWHLRFAYVVLGWVASDFT